MIICIFRYVVFIPAFVRTGYLTSKGDLVRSILYPPPVDFQFEKDSYKFIIILALIATVGMVYTLAKMVIDGEDATDIILEVFDLITIVVPPALPAAMTIGIVLANQRLLPKNIYCISPRTINVAGTTDCVCFDKTGTITEDGMDMWGVIPVTAGLAPLQGHSSTVGAGGKPCFVITFHMILMFYSSCKMSRIKKSCQMWKNWVILMGVKPN